jgi:hypothetical protein
MQLPLLHREALGRTIIVSPLFAGANSSQRRVYPRRRRGFPVNVPRMSKILSLCARRRGVSLRFAVSRFVRGAK